MLVLAYFVLPFLLAAQSLAAVSNQDTPCLSACGKWSDVVKSCYDQFSKSPHTNGLAYSNQFLGCLCTGKNSKGPDYGNSTMNQVAGVCQSCSTTPGNIKADLSTFLGLCTIQAQNGTASNASTFAPLGYLTGEEADGGHDSPTSNSAATSVLPSVPVMVGALAMLATSVLAAL